MATKEQLEYQEWLELCEQIRSTTQVIKQETPKQQDKRIRRLLNNFDEFCYYYFGKFIDSKLGWFHKEAAQKIEADKKGTFVLEWAREHAKSVFAAVFMPMFLKAKQNYLIDKKSNRKSEDNEFTGMVIVSANDKKAQTLLADIQAQLVSNNIYINDFGEQVSFGDWRSGEFSTRDSCGFWAFGRGQSVRGVRKGAKRPNYALIDDIDDKVICKNRKRVLEAVDWVWEGLYNALPTMGFRMIVAGNRIHKHSILAHIVGDIEVGDKVNENITHIKVYAIEDENRQASWFGQEGARPAWKERYKMKQLEDKFLKMPYHSCRKEHFHEHIEMGVIFQREWIHYIKPHKIHKYDRIVAYCDPSFKDTKNSDFKAIVIIGTKGAKVDVLDIWVRRTSISNMVKAFYDFYDKYGSYSSYWIEANMLQDLFLKEFDNEAEERGYHLPIRGDKTKKPDKVTRIMNLEPLFQRAIIRFAKELQGSPDMENFLMQLLGFPNASNDDGPDALEGAVIKINKQSSTSKFKPRMGRYKKSRR